MSQESNPDHYSLISLGSGEAGKYIVWTYASKVPGSRCAVIEQKWLGGSCPNIACLPSKNFIHSAKVAHYARHRGDYGIHGVQSQGTSDQAVKIDMETVRQRKREMVDGLVTTHRERFTATGSEYISGKGRFVGERKIEIELEQGGKRVVSADVVVVSTGSRARLDASIPGLVEACPLTHIEMLEVDKVPSHLIILGGGYIGLEFAQAMRRFGAQVSVIEHHDRILSHEDNDVATTLHDLLTQEGVRFHTNANVIRISGKSGDTVALECSSSSGSSFTIEGSHLLVATGRTPNTKDIGLEKAGVALTSSDHVQVDSRLRTTADSVFAVGDCAGSPHFTHIAFDDFRIVMDNLVGNRSRTTASRQVPSTLFTDPELAHIGLSEHEAKKQSLEYRLAKLPMKAFLRTRTLGQTEGFAKILVGKQDDFILGFTALGVGAGELLPAVQLAMANNLPYTALSDLIITHPTLAEGLVYLCMAVPSR